MITIIDYGLGNIRAFLNAYKRLNIEVAVASSAGELESASKVILPGVGAFDHAMQLLDGSGMRGALDRLVLRDGVPVLGVCVGMQILARSSDEGNLPGLGWIEGEVKRLASPAAANAIVLPHMGWNDVRPAGSGKLFGDLESGSRFYFLHSYYLRCDRDKDVLAVCDYGLQFSCAVNAGNIYGVQFHPEKSHRFGTRLLQNFAEL
jgi:imidazole glycerol-phosphate synthase subunit HisH